MDLGVRRGEPAGEYTVMTTGVYITQRLRMGEPRPNRKVKLKGRCNWDGAWIHNVVPKLHYLLEQALESSTSQYFRTNVCLGCELRSDAAGCTVTQGYSPTEVLQ